MDNEFMFQIDSSRNCVGKDLKVDISMGLNESENFSNVFKIN